MTLTGIVWFFVVLFIFWWLGLFQLAAYFIQVQKVSQPPVFWQPGEPHGKKILILGESIALGYGVQSAKEGFAGLIGAAFPDASVTVIALPFKGTGSLLKCVPDQGSYDVVVLTTSGNDLMNPDAENLRNDVEEMIEKCQHIARHIIVLGNFDNLYRARYFAGDWTCKFVPWCLQQFFARQGRRVRRTYEDVLQFGGLSNNLVAVQVFMERADTDRDGVHPNSLGHTCFADPIIRKIHLVLGS